MHGTTLQDVDMDDLERSLQNLHLGQPESVSASSKQDIIIISEHHSSTIACASDIADRDNFEKFHSCDVWTNYKSKPAHTHAWAGWILSNAPEVMTLGDAVLRKQILDKARQLLPNGEQPPDLSPYRKQASNHSEPPNAHDITFELKDLAMDKTTFHELLSVTKHAPGSPNTFKVYGNRKAFPKALLALPDEILCLVLGEIPLSKKTWTMLNSVCRKFRNIIGSRSFASYHLGRKLVPAIALVERSPGFYDQQMWMQYLEEYHELLSGDVAVVLDSDRSFPTTGDENLRQLLGTGLTLITFLRRIAAYLESPSSKSIACMREIVENVLPDQVVMLLRWTFYLFWYHGPKHSLKPNEAELKRRYGRPLPAQPVRQPPIPTPAAALPPTPTTNTVVHRRPCYYFKKLMSYESTFLFGPGYGPRHIPGYGVGYSREQELVWPLFASPELKPYLGGPIYWFLKESFRYALLLITRLGSATMEQDLTSRAYGWCSMKDSS